MNNTASGSESTVGGGMNNTASGFYATVSGGIDDTASGSFSTIGGGYLNTASGASSTIGGGTNNTASGPSGTLGGGGGNAASGNYSTVGGGISNTASGDQATVPGGSQNIAAGDYSFAAGEQARANHHGTFVWADNSNAIFASTANAQFLIRASGGVGIGTNAPGYRLDVAGACHATSFPTSSDARLKTDVRQLTDVLEKLKKIRGVSFEWNETYESLGRSTERREIGVIAQEVEAVFPELISTWSEKDYKAVDYGRLTGVLIEAIKELSAENESLRLQLETTNTKLGQLTGTVELILAAQKKSAGDKLAGSK
jgi:hypothetical protein